MSLMRVLIWTVVTLALVMTLACGSGVRAQDEVFLRLQGDCTDPIEEGRVR